MVVSLPTANEANFPLGANPSSDPSSRLNATQEALISSHQKRQELIREMMMKAVDQRDSHLEKYNSTLRECVERCDSTVQACQDENSATIQRFLVTQDDQERDFERNMLMAATVGQLGSTTIRNSTYSSSSTSRLNPTQEAFASSYSQRQDLNHNAMLRSMADRSSHVDQCAFAMTECLKESSSTMRQYMEQSMSTIQQFLTTQTELETNFQNNLVAAATVAQPSYEEEEQEQSRSNQPKRYKKTRFD